MEFAKSGIESIGMELEFQLLDKDSLDLVNGIIPLMELCSGNEYYTPEFIQNTVEIASKKCFSIKELDTHFHEVTRELDKHTRSLDMRLCGAGTHPFSTQMAHVTPRARYLEMEKAENYRSHTQITFATHVHLGMESAEDAITIMRAVKPFLPLILALSANSPFWHGHDTGYASYRHRVLAATRSYGVPPAFKNWQEFETFFELSKKAELYDTDSDIHWDVRPRPQIGTLEIRIMDAQSTVSDAIMRAAFIQALVFFLRERFARNTSPKKYEYQYWLEKDNVYQASHLGLRTRQTNVGLMLNDDLNEVVMLHNVFGLLLNDIIEFIQGSEKFSQLVDLSYLYQLRDQIAEPYGYQKQKQDFEDRLSLKYVTQRMVDALAEDLKE